MINVNDLFANDQNTSEFFRYNEDNNDLAEEENI